MNRRGFLGLLGAAIAAVKMHKPQHDVPGTDYATSGAARGWADVDASVVQRRLYRTNVNGSSYTLIATAGPHDSEWIPITKR